MSNPFLKQVFNKDKTFRPKRKFEPGTQRFELHKKAQASLNAGLDLKLAVQLPPRGAHVNTCYKHFYYFVKEFGLIDTKELEPLRIPSRLCPVSPEPSVGFDFTTTRRSRPELKSRVGCSTE
uniref:MOB kinase activator 3A n=1 Tax=Lynx canadensis TaxID=61383 RepID=A0A667G6G7_LYNCA